MGNTVSRRWKLFPEIISPRSMRRNLAICLLWVAMYKEFGAISKRRDPVTASVLLKTIFAVR